MINIMFIAHSIKIHLYFYKCIEACAKENSCFQTAILIDEKMKAPNVSFSSSINWIDSKFSNFKENPLAVIDLNKISSKYTNVEIFKNYEELKFCDWIVLESNRSNTDVLNRYTRYGILTLNTFQNSIYNNLFNSDSLFLQILHQSTDSKNWSVFEQIDLKKEQGIKNNTYKILFNYSVFLTKLLRNNQVKTANIFSLKNRKSLVLKLNILYYYINLVIIIIKRKLDKSNLNWKLGIKKNEELHFIDQPKQSFWADPFVVKSEDDIYVYFEELKENNIGRISCIHLDSTFNIKEKQIILDESYHFSYPNVFFKDNNYYMIPESNQNNTLQLYKCDNFPFLWSHKMNLMEDIKLLDSNWIYHNNLYWIFANKVENFEYDNNERLYLYYSEDLFSQNWQSHIKNPIIVDASLARNAGNLWVEDGKLFRVSQNCKHGYGENLVLNRIVELNTTNYVEEKIRELFPPKNYVGIHTQNRCEDIYVYDFLYKEHHHNS